MSWPKLSAIDTQNPQMNCLCLRQFPQFNQDGSQRGLVRKEKQTVAAPKFSAQLDSAPSIEQCPGVLTPRVFESREIVVKSRAKFLETRVLPRYEPPCPFIQPFGAREPARVL